MLCVLPGHVPDGRRIRGELYSIMESEGRSIEWFTKRIPAQQHSGLYVVISNAFEHRSLIACTQLLPLTLFERREDRLHANSLDTVGQSIL
jgi:hypothetical protein